MIKPDSEIWEIVYYRTKKLDCTLMYCVKCYAFTIIKRESRLPWSICDDKEHVCLHLLPHDYVPRYLGKEVKGDISLSEIMDEDEFFLIVLLE